MTRSKREKGYSKIVGYTRVSTMKQENGLESQRQAIERFVKDENAQLLEIIEERASGKRDDRPGLKKALGICAEAGATLVIAKLDRLSREVKHLFTFRDAGVDFIALDLPDLNTLTLSVLAGFAQHERERISERTKAGLEIARSKGKVFGNPDGFSDAARMKSIDSRKEKAVSDLKNLTGKKHVEMFLEEGYSLREIARRLERLEIPTARGGKWSPVAVKRIIDLYNLKKDQEK